MVNANELRIGNLVDFFGKIKTVIRIGKESSGWYIGCSDNQNELMNCWNIEDAYDPIPLTEVWLLRFGFTWSHYHQDTAQREYYGINDFHVCKLNSRFYYDNTKLEYVHQLQNLYFALTQEELCLKP